MPVIDRSELSKKVTHAGTGIDQIGNDIGTPRMGDIVKVHIKGSYYAQRPLFRLCNKDYFLKQRKVDFLHTHFIGETAFVSVHIGNSSKNAFNDEDGYGLGKLVRVAVEGMAFGEAAVFTSDNVAKALNFGSDKGSKKSICRGHVEADAEVLVLEIESFRIVRDGREHFRQVRNGYGGRSWTMEAPL